jgi:uncharacterized membrane protein SpoIIM required for sporulation
MYRKDPHLKNFLPFLADTTLILFTFSKKTFNSYYLRQFILFLLVCSVFLSVILLKSPSLLFCLLVSILTTALIQYIGKQFGLTRRSLIPLQILVAVGIFSGFWLDYFADPAQAQFFKKAEDFFQNTLTQGSGTTNNTQAPISLVFNILRAIYLLYIAGSLVSVINAVRKDEEWQSMARKPLLVVIAVTMADVLTGFIIGDTGK